MQSRESIANFIFRLGRGMCKAISLLGAIVDEIIYEPYNYKPRSEIVEITSKEQDKLESKPPKIGIELLNKQFESSEKSVRALHSKFLKILWPAIQIPMAGRSYKAFYKCSCGLVWLSLADRTRRVDNTLAYRCAINGD